MYFLCIDMKVFLVYISFAVSTAFPLTYDERSEKQNLNSYSDPLQLSLEDIRKSFDVPNEELLQQSSFIWIPFFNSQNNQDKISKDSVQWIHNGLDYSGSGSPVQKGVGSEAIVITESSEPINPQYFQKSPLIVQMPLQWLIQSDIYKPANWFMLSNYNQDSVINSTGQFGKDSSPEKDYENNSESDNILEDPDVYKLPSKIDGFYSPLGKDSLPAKVNEESLQSNTIVFDDIDVNPLTPEIDNLFSPLGKDDLPSKNKQSNNVLEDTDVNKLPSEIDHFSSPLRKDGLPAKANEESLQSDNILFQNIDVNKLTPEIDVLSSPLRNDDLPKKVNEQNQQFNNALEGSDVNKLTSVENGFSELLGKDNLLEKDSEKYLDIDNNVLEDPYVNKLASKGVYLPGPLEKKNLPEKSNKEDQQPYNTILEGPGVNKIISESDDLPGPLIIAKSNEEDHQSDNNVLEDSNVNKLFSKRDGLSSPLGKNNLHAKVNGESTQSDNIAFEDTDINKLPSEKDGLFGPLGKDDLPAKGNMEDQQSDNVFKDVIKLIIEGDDLSRPVVENNLPVSDKVVDIGSKNDLVESNEDASKFEENYLTESNDLPGFKENHKLFNNNCFLAGAENILLKQKENGLNMNLGKDSSVVNVNEKNIESTIQSELNSKVGLLKSETGYLLDPLTKAVLPKLRNQLSAEMKEHPKTGLNQKKNNHPEGGPSKRILNGNIHILGQEILLQARKNAMFKHPQKTSKKPMEIGKTVQDNAIKSLLSADNMRDVQKEKENKKHQKFIKKPDFLVDQNIKVHALDNSVDITNTNKKTSTAIYEPKWDNTHLINKRQIAIFYPPQSGAYATSNLQSSAAFATSHRYNTGRYGQYGGYHIYNRS